MSESIWDVLKRIADNVTRVSNTLEDLNKTLSDINARIGQTIDAIEEFEETYAETPR